MRSRSRRWIGRALTLAPRERAHALRAVTWLAASGLAVRVLPFSTIARWIERIPRSRSTTVPPTPGECAVAMARASRVLPGERCLARAVAACCLLRRAGRAPAIRMGVALDPDRHLEAHAWLECDGLVVTGGNVPGRYVPLDPLGRGGT